jgi:hypothetical protein
VRQGKEGKEAHLRMRYIWEEKSKKVSVSKRRTRERGERCTRSSVIHGSPTWALALAAMVLQRIHGGGQFQSTTQKKERKSTTH